MSDRASTQDRLRQALAGITYGQDSQDLATAGRLKGLTFCDAAVRVTVSLPAGTGPAADRLSAAIRDRLSLDEEVEHVNLTIETVAPGEANPLGDSAAPIRNIVAVGSGKGGVGKSTVAVNLAVALARGGAKVGILDADIYGPSIPTMLGKKKARSPLASKDEGKELIGTLEAHGVQLASMGFLIENEDEPVIWRGPMLHNALSSLYKKVAWGELDWLIVDLPPGTGDVALSLAQSVRLTGAVIVSTPQEVAMVDARKALGMFRKTNVRPLGVVENMSGPIFGEGGAKVWAEKEGIPFLGSVPLDVRFREAGDAGLPAAGSEDPEVSAPWLAVAEAIALEAAAALEADGDAKPISLQRPAEA